MRENEAYLHYIWSNKLLNSSSLLSTKNQIIEIFDWGQYNRNENGPDFKFASIRYAGLIWYGHIEFHLKSSDWFKHKHHLDPQYENIILHVVRENDINEDLFPFPTLILENSNILPSYHEKVNGLVKSKIICNNQITKTIFKKEINPEIYIKKRVKNKAELISSSDLRTASIAGFGKNTNKHVFKFISENWPKTTMQVSEFVHVFREDINYIKVTKSAYSNGKFNFIIRALEMFITYFDAEILDILHVCNPIEIINRFKKSSWFFHNQSIGFFLLINVWLPYFFSKKLLNWQQINEQYISLPPENNVLLKQWKKLGVIPKNALESQVVLEIYSQLCIKKKCLICPIGRALLV